MWQETFAFQQKKIRRKVAKYSWSKLFLTGVAANYAHLGKDFAPPSPRPQILRVRIRASSVGRRRRENGFSLLFPQKLPKTFPTLSAHERREGSREKTLKSVVAWGRTAAADEKELFLLLFRRGRRPQGCKTLVPFRDAVWGMESALEWCGVVVCLIAFVARVWASFSNFLLLFSRS